MRDGAPPTIAVSTGFTDYGDYLGVSLSRPLVATGAVPLLLPYLEDEAARAAALGQARGDREAVDPAADDDVRGHQLQG